MLRRFARWLLRLLGRLDLVFLELSGDAERAWITVRGELGPILPESLARIRPFHPAYPCLHGLIEHEGEGKYRLTGDQVWEFLDRFAGRTAIRFEAKSSVAWKKVPPEPIEVEVQCDPTGPSLRARYLGEARWARGKWLRRGDAWWNADLTDEHAELFLKREVTYGPEKVRKVLTEFAPSWTVRGSIWKVDPQRSLAETRVEPEPDGTLTVRCRYTVPKFTPLHDGWALVEDFIAPLPKLPPTVDRALQDGPVRLNPEEAADFLGGEGAGLLEGARVATQSKPVITAKMERETLLLELSFVWGENAFALESEMRGRRTLRRGLIWCRVEEKAIDEAHALLVNGLRRAYLDPRPEETRLRLRHDDVPEFLAHGSDWFKEWSIIVSKGPSIQRGPTKALLKIRRSMADGLGFVGVDAEFDLAGTRVPLAELAPLVAEGARWLRRDSGWIEFDRPVVQRILEMPLRLDAHRLGDQMAAWKTLGEVTIEEEVKRLRMVIDGGRPSATWPFTVSSPGAVNLYSWFATCAEIGVNPTVLATVDRDLCAAVAALITARKERGGCGPILIVARAKRLASWAEGLSTLVPIRSMTLKRKAPSQEELAAVDVLLVAPNSLETAVYRAVDLEWPLVVFDQLDATFPTDTSKSFRAAASLRARMRIGAVANRDSVGRLPKMRALQGLVYPGIEADPLHFPAPFSYDPTNGGHLIVPSLQPVRTVPKSDPLVRRASEILREPDPKRAIAQLQGLWRTQRVANPKRDEWMIDWIADLYYLHVGSEAGLAWQWKHLELLPRFPEIDLLLERQDGQAPLAAWMRLAGYRPSGKFYEQYREQADDAYRKAIETIAPRPPERTFRVRRKLFRCGSSFEIVVGRARAWSSLAGRVTAIVKHAENLLREKLGVRERVRGYEIDPETASLLVTGKIQLSLDLGLVDRLQKESAEVAEILAAPEDQPVELPEERVEPVRAADGRMLYTSLKEMRALWHHLDFVQRQVVTEVYRGSIRRLRELEVQLRPTGQMPLAAIEGINERAQERLGDVLLVLDQDALLLEEEFRDELEVVIDGKVASAEESDPYRALVSQLTEPEKALVVALARDGALSSVKVDDLLRPHGVMSSVAIDTINEKACGSVGDIVLVVEGTTVAVEEDDMEPLRRALA